MCHRQAFTLAAFDRCRTGAKCTAPTDDKQLTIFWPDDFLLRDIIRNVVDLLLTYIRHVLVVIRIITDVAGDILFFQAANSVLQPRRAGQGPGSRQPLISGIRLKLLPLLRLMTRPLWRLRFVFLFYLYKRQ